MREHSDGFKQQIKELGKEQAIKITYGDVTLTEEHIYDVSYFFNGSLLKSIMKGLTIESDIDIPLDTQIKLEYGLLVNGAYEYIDMGSYIVIESEKKEDNGTYLIKAYDKMVNSMKTYESLDITYPITVDNYIKEICIKLGFAFANTDNYANKNKLINGEVYTNEFTFRDILDDIAEVTASMVCINNENMLEIRYPNNTTDIIDEEYLKDINVNFGKKYGKINSIVLSRSGGSDNVYIQDTASVESNGLCEVKIVDNMIMNDNNRSDFLADLLTKLGGIEYYINDFSSTGIIYLEPYDKYKVSIDGNYYDCILLNDEINITQGLEEIIYTDEPIASETDYTKADKTDQKINQTYLIVDKQNQTIESVVKNVDGQDQKIAQLTQSVGELESKITDISDITTSGDSIYAMVELSQVNESEPIYIKIQPNGVNITHLYPRNNLYPSDDLYMKGRTLRFLNTDTNEVFDYELEYDLLYYNSTYFDEFILSYDEHICQINKKCDFDLDGNVEVLTSPITLECDYPKINLTSGNYKVSLLNYSLGYLQVKLMASNIYTTQFATKVEMNSAITQTAQEINLSVNKELTNYATKSQLSSVVSIQSNLIMSEVSEKVGNDEVISRINQSSESITIDANKINLNGKNINLTGDNISISSTNFNVNSSGKVTCKDIDITGGNIKLVDDSSNYDSLISITDTWNLGKFQTSSTNFQLCRPHSISEAMQFGIMMDITEMVDEYGQAEPTILLKNYGTETYVSSSGITTPSITQTSLESKKDNIKLYDENALDIVKNSEIYTYNFKDSEHKKYGFVIGDLGGNYKTPTEVIGMNGNGIDTYNMISILWKAVQDLQKEIEILKEEKNG